MVNLKLKAFSLIIVQMMVLLFSVSSHASNDLPPILIQGPSTGTTGTTAVYYVDDGTSYGSPGCSMLGVSAQGQIIGYSEVGTRYEITVMWVNSGTATVYFFNECNGTNYPTKSVTVSCTTTVPDPVINLAGGASCGSKILSYTETPPAGVTWYWQTSTTGTSTANSTQSYTATSTGYYYVRAKANCGAYWSTGYAITANPVTINPLPSSPSGYTISTNICGDKVLSKMVAPPAGINWYWQGTNASGTDNTSPQATGATYSASIYGNNTYYIRAQDTGSGCWSTSTAITNVVVNTPPAPSNASFTACEFESPYLTTGGVIGTLRWYNSLGALVNTGSTYSVSPMNNGTYVYTVKNYVSTCEGPGATVTLQVGTASCDNLRNWIQEKVYGINGDGSPKEINSSKIYTDGLGNTIQAQSKSYANNQVFASQSIYDSYGEQTLTTLPAPINSSIFGYKHRFAMSSSSAVYSKSDFDLTTTTGASGEVNNPKPVVNTGPGSLGWYYSTSNNLEPATPATSYPYTRSWTEKIAKPKRSKGAGAGEAHKMGSNHEAQGQEMNFTKSELSHYFSLQNHFATLSATPETNLITNSKAITTYGYSSQSGARLSNVTLSSQTYIKVETPIVPLGSSGAYPIEGTKTVVPGTTYKFRVKGYRSSSTAVYLMVKNVTANTNISWTSIALPQGSANENWVEASFTVPAGCTQIRVGVMWSSTSLSSDSFYINDAMLYQTFTDSNLIYGTKQMSTDPDGRKVMAFIDGNGKTLASALVTSVSGTYPNQTFTYDNWSYSYYNDIGQLLATVAPNGVNTGSSAYPSFVTTYKYDHLGRMYEAASTDDGTSKYVYSLDGKIRFSQSQEQRNASPQRFSYTNYDYLGRLIESGEYIMSGSGYYVFETHNTTTPAGNSVLNIIDNTGYTGVTRRKNNSTASRYSDTTFVDYDFQAADFVADAYHTSQENLRGDVSRTKNGNATTWYSYDEFGVLSWSKQNINGLGPKTVDYTYDYLGNVTEIAYQKGQADDFYHHYIYDDDQNLSEVWTSLDGTNKTLRAKYYYYLHGLLKRLELANNVQGIDYVYTIDGALKSINNADPTKDPGVDGANGFAPDVFGQTMHYYTNDYSATYNAGTQTFSGYTDQYSGALKGISWHSPVDNNSQSRTYAYTYDNKLQLNEAKFGNYQSGAFTPDALEAYKENIPAYDKNGNIQSLARKGKGGTTLGSYNYVYEANSNRLDKVNHNSALLVDYTYNAIGQMTQQTEGTNTMNVKYNASGLVDYVTKPVTNQGVVYEWTTGWAQEGSSTNSFDINTGNIICESQNPIVLEDGVNHATKRVYHSADISKGLTYTVSYSYEITDGQPSDDQYSAELYLVLWRGNVKTYKLMTSFYLENTYSGNYVFKSDNDYDRIGFVVSHQNAKNYFISVNNFDVTSSEMLLVKYAYGDTGELLKRTDYNDSSAVKNTFYVRDVAGNPLAIYEQVLPSGTPQLIELPIYGAGRVALFKPLINTYFYEINDHLGNVRAVIGTTDTDVYTATMESENAGTEEPPFKNIAARRVVSVAANHTTSGNETIRLNNTQAAGPAISLKVSPGDLIDLETWAYYESGTSYNNTIGSSSMITAIASAFGGVSGAPGEPGQIFNSINNALGVGAGSIGLGATGDPALPGAYICYMVFDVNKSFTGQGGYYRVTSAGNLAKELIAIPQVTIEQPGYIYVCVYNRSDSPNWVYFDDMKVTHAHSPVVAGADYFPFGLPMEGREITQEDYRWGYQGQYAEEDTVTGWNQFQLRMYDARFGRWLSVDPYGQFSSPYVAMGNAPNMYSDPDGGFCCGGVLPELVVTAARVTLGTIGEIILTSAATRLFLTAAEAQLNMNFYENKIGDGGKYGSGLDKGWETELTTEPTPVPRVISRPDPFTVAKQDLPGLISKLPSAETVQTVASIAGLIPGANTVAGIIEAGAALAAGDYAGAIFAGITAIPVIGVGVRWGKLLMQAHHVIPKAVIAKYGLKALRGFKSEAMKNIKRLPFPFHAWHPQYNKYVGNQIDKLGPLLNVEKLGELQNHLKREIRNAWRVHKQGNARTLNEYFRELNKTQ